MPLDIESKKGDNPDRVLKNCNDDEGLQSNNPVNKLSYL